MFFLKFAYFYIILYNLIVKSKCNIIYKFHSFWKDRIIKIIFYYNDIDTYIILKLFNLLFLF